VKSIEALSEISLRRSSYIGIREQRLDRDLGETGIAVEFLAVGISELGAFDLQMDEFGAGGIEPVECKSLEQRKLLQHHRALAPDAGLLHGVAAVVVGERRFDRRHPARHVIRREDALVRRARDIHDGLRAAELVDRFRHEAMRPGFSRALDLRDTVGARAFGLFEDAGIGLGELWVGEDGAGLRHFVVRQVDCGRSRPVLAEQLFHGLDGGAGALDQRIAIAGIGYRGFQHVAQPHCAVVAQQQHPGFERAGNAGREEAGAGHHFQSLALVMRDRRLGRRRPLAADDFGAATLDVMHDDRHVAARTVQMRLDHLQSKGGRNPGVKGVAAFLQRRHPDRGRDPVGRGHDAEGALDLGPGRERIGIDVAGHGIGSFFGARALDHSEAVLPTGMPAPSRPQIRRGQGLD
jgi:hypothetical protein